MNIRKVICLVLSLALMVSVSAPVTWAVEPQSGQSVTVPSGTDAPAQEQEGEPESDRAASQTQDCDCGENAPENLANHADSCPRKQYILGLIRAEGSGYKTAQAIYADWSGYDRDTQQDILNMTEVYCTTTYYELVELLNSQKPGTEQVVGDKTFCSDGPIVVQETAAEKAAQILVSHDFTAENTRAWFFDIHGEEEERTRISVSGILDTDANRSAVVIHLLDSVQAIRNATELGGIAWNYFTVADASQFPAETAAAKAVSGEENRVYYVTLLTDIAADGTISFETDSFSSFVFLVTFSYDGYTYDMSGGSSVYLSDLLRTLDLADRVGQVTDVIFSGERLLEVEKVQNDWRLTSRKSFHSAEFLTVFFQDGTSIQVKVTDTVVKYFLYGNDKWNDGTTEGWWVNRSDSTTKPYGTTTINTAPITTGDISDAADDKSDTIDMVLYARPQMAIRFTAGIGFPDGSFNLANSDAGAYKHDGKWEWVWSGDSNYILLENLEESTYFDITLTADGKSCQVRIYIIPNKNNGITKVADTVQGSDTYTVKTIPVTLYDYDGQTWNRYWSKQNSGYWYAFHGPSQGVTAQDGVTLPWNTGHLPNSGNLSQGVFQDRLVNNLPVFASTAQTDLFSKTTNTEMGKTVYNNVAFEFIYELETGYYTYSSNLNHAQYNSSTNTIELYDQSLSAQIGDVSTVMNAAAGFYPFVRIENALLNYAYSGMDWQGHLSDAYTSYSGQFSVDPVSTNDANSSVNMHYGIQIEADFYMPQDRLSQVDHKELVYEFTGDDDLWVFVDDQLVLDLGGAHTPVNGSINFTQQTVYLESYYPVTASGNTYTEGTPETGKTFTFAELGIEVMADQMHTLRVFYMERWSGESNCRMRFNLPIAPDNSVTVSKELTNQDGEPLSVTPDVDYTFALYYAKDTEDIVNQPDSAFQPLANAQYTIQGTNQTGCTNEQGEFTLKAGQTALFERIDRFTEVYAVEKDIEDGYIYTAHSVSVNREKATAYTLGSKTETKIIQRTGVLSFAFANRMLTQPLTISKEVVNGRDGLILKDQQFTFNLEFTRPILEKGQEIAAKDGKTVTDGGTFQLGHGESLTIPRVPVNMTFTFGEENPDPAHNSFDLPKYELTLVKCSEEPEDFKCYSCTVQNGGENKIQVINQQRFDLTISKTGISDQDHQEGDGEKQSTLYTVVGMANGKEIYRGQVAIAGNGSITIKGLPVGVYTVTEDTNWSWRYDPVDAPVQTPSITTPDVTVAYVNDREKDTWLSGDCYAENWWGRKKEQPGEA